MLRDLGVKGGQNGQCFGNCALAIDLASPFVTKGFILDERNLLWVGQARCGFGCGINTLNQFGLNIKSGYPPIFANPPTFALYGHFATPTLDHFILLPAAGGTLLRFLGYFSCHWNPPRDILWVLGGTFGFWAEDTFHFGK